VFVLANIIIDIEVLAINLLGAGRPMHRYFHTLLIGAAAGAVWAIAAYPLRHLFKKIMHIIRIPYETSFWKMLVSGVLGVWLHIITDATYHGDVRIFWPSRTNPLWRLLTHQQIRLICVGCVFAALILYVIAFISYTKQNKAKKVL
jgi:membrane-bound metal-dependent hydrolase YbcI (DUF457 family)